MPAIRSTLIGLVTLLALVLPSRKTRGELMVFTDRSNWESTVGATDTEDFNNAELQWLMTGAGFTFSEHRMGKLSIGAKGDYLGVDYNPTIRDTIDQLSPNGTQHLGGILSNIEVIMQAAIIFDHPVSAFGADWASATNQGGVILNVNKANLNLADYLSGTGTGFLGIVSTEPFQEVVLTSPRREDYGLDNISFQIPEPSVSSFVVMLSIVTTGMTRFRQRCPQLALSPIGVGLPS
ncbi:MAG: hypothetical protein ACR2NM_06105 [Bythopirellula sp.]